MTIIDIVMTLQYNVVDISVIENMKELIQIRIDGELKEDVEREAKRRGLSVSELIRTLLLAAVEEKKVFIKVVEEEYIVDEEGS